jgi:hypothetical protein
VLEVENEADSPERQEEAEELLATLSDTAPDPARVARLARLGRAVGATYLRIAAVETIERGLQRAMWASLTPAGRRWANGAGPTLDGRLARAEWAAFETMVTLLRTYRPLSDAELDELVRFSESPAGRWAADAYRDGLLGALEAAGERAHAALRGGR